MPHAVQPPASHVGPRSDAATHASQAVLNLSCNKSCFAVHRHAYHNLGSRQLPRPGASLGSGRAPGSQEAAAAQAGATRRSDPPVLGDHGFLHIGFHKLLQAQGVQRPHALVGWVQQLLGSCRLQQAGCRVVRWCCSAWGGADGPRVWASAGQQVQRGGGGGGVGGGRGGPGGWPGFLVAPGHGTQHTPPLPLCGHGGGLVSWWP